MCGGNKKTTSTAFWKRVVIKYRKLHPAWGETTGATYIENLPVLTKYAVIAQGKTSSIDF